MVPFHESDVAENRWKEGEWRTFELWEKIEVRLRRRRFWTVFGVAILFLAILAIPIVRDRSPKWVALTAMRRLAVRVSEMKVEAAALGAPMRIRLEAHEDGPSYRIERVASCGLDSGGAAPSLEEKARGVLFPSVRRGHEYSVLSVEDATRLGLTRIVSSFCYDPKDPQRENGNAPTESIGLIAVKDLANGRLDRIAFLNFSGLSAEIDFD